MSDGGEMAAQHDGALAELLELGLAAAREVQARLLAAEDARAASDLSLAFNRISRSVRQTVALQARLGRERDRQARDAAAEARRAEEARVSRRKAQVRAAVERAVWTEAEADEAERLLDDLDDLVSEEALYDGFADGPVEAHIARLRHDLGLSDPPPATEGRGAGSQHEPAGEVSPMATEGGAAHSPFRPAPPPPRSLRDNSPDGGASDRRSSA